MTPSLTALNAELPPTVARPKFWHLHTVAEVLFIIGLFAVWIEFGGGS